MCSSHIVFCCGISRADHVTESLASHIMLCCGVSRADHVTESLDVF